MAHERKKQSIIIILTVFGIAAGHTITIKTGTPYISVVGAGVGALMGEILNSFLWKKEIDEPTETRTDKKARKKADMEALGAKSAQNLSNLLSK